jgi:hypothetical protein
MSNILEKRLWNVAYNEAKSYNLHFASDCERYLREMITRGVMELKTRGYERDENKLSDAERNLRLFIAEMVKEAKRQNLSKLHENTFYAAKNSLCPIWPFC